jgi:hypothetical protein
MMAERFEIERGSAEAVDSHNDGARALAGWALPQGIGKSLAVGGLPFVAGGGHGITLEKLATKEHKELKEKAA